MLSVAIKKMPDITIGSTPSQPDKPMANWYIKSAVIPVMMDVSTSAGVDVVFISCIPLCLM